MSPGAPEPFFDLARLEATLGETQPALQDLQTAIRLNDARRQTNAMARDLRQQARTDANLKSLRSLPAFQALMSGN